MLITARTAFATRCPQCGQMETTTLSRFEVTSGRSVKVDCSCGSHKFTVGVRSGQVWLQLPCYLCDGVHFYYYGTREFWRTGLQSVICSDTDLRLGVFGQEAEVDTYIRTGGSELDRLVEDEAFSEYFDEPEVMFEVLSRVHTLAEEGTLDCSCGSRHIAVDVFPERLELTCSACGNHMTVPAGSQEDLSLLQTVTGLRVGKEPENRRREQKNK